MRRLPEGVLIGAVPVPVTRTDRLDASAYPITRPCFVTCARRSERPYSTRQRKTTLPVAEVRVNTRRHVWRWLSKRASSIEFAASSGTARDVNVSNEPPGALRRLALRVRMGRTSTATDGDSSSPLKTFARYWTLLSGETGSRNDPSAAGVRVAVSLHRLSPSPFERCSIFTGNVGNEDVPLSNEPE